MQLSLEQHLAVSHRDSDCECWVQRKYLETMSGDATRALKRGESSSPLPSDWGCHVTRDADYPVFAYRSVEGGGNWRAPLHKSYVQKCHLQDLEVVHAETSWNLGEVNEPLCPTS